MTMTLYREAKAASGGAVLLIRRGDYYEAYYQDAAIVADVLNLTRCTYRINGCDVPVAGFTYCDRDHFVQQLVSAGHRVALCDEPAPGDPRNNEPCTRCL